MKNNKEKASAFLGIGCRYGGNDDLGAYVGVVTFIFCIHSHCDDWWWEDWTPPYLDYGSILHGFISMCLALFLLRRYEFKEKRP